MNEINYKGILIVCDMDGTLLNSNNEVSGKNIEAIKSFVDAGGWFTVASGRPESAIKPFIEDVPINVPAILYNGTVLYDFEKEKVIYGVYVHESIKNITGELLEKFPEIGSHVYMTGKIACLKRNEVIRRCESREFSFPDLTTIDQIDDEPWHKVLFGAKPDVLKKIEEHLRNRELNATVVYSEDEYLEILPLNASKGNVLKKLMLELGCNKENVIALGDHLNDVELIKSAGVGVAVANAQPELKSVAKLCVSSNDEHAVAQLISLVEKGIQLKALEERGRGNGRLKNKCNENT
jgi:Cof subfamily protein (haloacid dehalogenase superfamily)